ncbi:MAG TPA: hypothetical protein VKM55_21625 [Candidatus Lokiarchaeia archaeon]|nr:hypothetical protein [Candidatus Lokiarchaeia archaeon]
MIQKTGTPSWNKQHFIRISAITNVVTWGLMLGQYIWYFSITGAVFIAVLGEFYIMCLGVVLSLFTWWFPRLHSRFLKGFAGIIHLVLFLAFLFLALLFNGPFGVPLFIIEVGIAFLNFIAFIEHVTSWKDTVPFQNAGWRKNVSRVIKSGPAIAVACLAVFGLLSINSFWMTITIKAPDNAKTTSSYWGNPELNITSWSTSIMSINNRTLQITPAKLSSAPAEYANGSFAYVETVFLPVNLTKNYADYQNGARSYPNGTVFLSATLPNPLTIANITFDYVQNWNVLQMLGETNATVILNGFGGYINDTDPFHHIKDTDLFQLLDYWHVKFYLQVDANDDYSHVFNYLSVTPLAHRALEWAMQWHEFQGISFDCEQESYPQPATNRPGYIPLFPGSLIPDSWSSIKQLWYWENEQNDTLFTLARAAYDEVFQHALALGKNVYIVLNPTDFSEYIDGDEDYHSNPAIPFSSRPNVFYAQMSYHDEDAHGQFALYRDCVESIKQLGNRGSSILTGWVSHGATYYTPDEAGFQNYVNDCLIAQAAGITEIFHAPLYGIQNQWGDDAILKLHQALNDAPKKSFVIQVIQFTNFFIWDLWKNFNRPFFYIIVLCGFVAATLLEVPHGRRIKQLK